MAIRLLSWGVVLGLANLANLGLAPVTPALAGHAEWSTPAPARRPQFRPWYRPADAGEARWRPLGGELGRRSSPRVPPRPYPAPGAIFEPVARAQATVPVRTRDRGPWQGPTPPLAFRPLPGARSLSTQSATGSTATAPQTLAAFRPLQGRRSVPTTVRIGRVSDPAWPPQVPHFAGYWPVW